MPVKRMNPDQVGISEIVRHELEFGICRSVQIERNRANLQHLLTYVATLPFGESEAMAAAEIRCDLAAKGQPIGPYDVLIAAHARSMGATLVTHNVREFKRVKGLLLVDWEA